MKSSRAVAGVQENHLSSNFILEHNHPIVDNQFDMSQDHLMQIDNDEAENNSDANLTPNDKLDHINVPHCIRID